MSHIFVSYARKDKDFVERVVQALKAGGRKVWIDRDDIPKGEDWEQEIRRAIEEAAAFLFLLSPASAASIVCGQEVEHAVQNHKRILPILIRDTQAGELRSETARREISKRSWITCREAGDVMHLKGN